MLAKQSPEWRQWRLDYAGILFYVARPEIVVIGLGYVGLPVAATFAHAGSPVIGFDIDPEQVRELPAGRDRTREVDAIDLRLAPLNLTCDLAGLRPADFFIVTMPTSIDTANRPDLSAIFDASRMVGTALKKGDIVVYESTVYPGAVEENCVPILERNPGLKARTDFDVGYSPERVISGDMKHRFETTTCKKPCSVELRRL
jgi:UDP-N-acetyl-D-galactosamine dehydrogenase